jgi:KAP family P-loop domain
MWADNETSEDLLGFKVHADLIIDLIHDETVLPVTIGVFGDWGSGKSSILHIIKNEFEKEENKDSLCIYFNGWTFEGYDDAKAALLNAILKELEDNKKLTDEVKDTVKEKAKKLWKSINWMRGAGMVFKNIALPAISAYFTGGLSLIPFAAQRISEWGVDSPEKLIEKLRSSEGEQFFKSLITENSETDDKTNAVVNFRKDFEDLLKATKFKKLVVLIDDLDRCTPERIIDNLEAIKLFLNVPNTAFIIGADPRIVKHAIEYKYGVEERKLDSENPEIVKDYLEKLIQIPYSLPKLSDSEVETYISLLICKRELSKENFAKVHEAFSVFRNRDRYSVFGFSNLKDLLDTAAQEAVLKGLSTIPSLVPVITSTLSGNPRQIKRFLNALTLRQKLAKVANIVNFDIAVLTKLMVLEYSNIELPLFNQLYEWQSIQKGRPVQLKLLEDIATSEQDFEKTKAKITAENEIAKWATGRIYKWLKVEPPLAEVDLSDYFWLSRDKLSSTIPGASLIPTIVKNIYLKLDNDSLPEAVSKKIINDEVASLRGTFP